MGEPERADPNLLPDLSFIDETPEDSRITATIPTAANYLLISDNILDLSHLDFVHAQTLGGTMAAAERQSQMEGNSVVMHWASKGVPTPLGLRAMVPGEKCDVSYHLEWQVPGIMILNVTATAPGVPPAWENERLTLHNVTPETASTTHYFVCSTRRFALGNIAVTEQIRAALMRAFVQEDKPVIEKQQQRIGNADFWSLKPVLLPIDSGAAHARRKMESMIAAEVAPSN
jgi:vanillate O-demethylase monooxygenase subunit